MFSPILVGINIQELQVHTVLPILKELQPVMRLRPSSATSKQGRVLSDTNIRTPILADNAF